LQPDWTQKEIYGILFLNNILSNPEADGWNFSFNGRSIKSNEEQKVTDWEKMIGNGTVRISPLQNGDKKFYKLVGEVTDNFSWNPFEEVLITMDIVLLS
jgi:hypothetical protein